MGIPYSSVSLFLIFIPFSTVHTAEGACEEIQVPMCKGLVGYNMTRLPNVFNHTTQNQVYWALQPLWPFMDMGCSNNLRLLMCGLFLPKCTPGSNRVQLPCRETCRRAKMRCSPQMRQQGQPWTRQFRCPQFLPKRSRRCLGPLKEKKKKRPWRYVSCRRNTLSMCSDIQAPYTHGSLPNMFLQYSIRDMETEMRQYEPLVQSGCSNNLKFFLCGVFMPYCVQNENQDIPFLVPCREVCEDVYQRCYSVYRRQRNGVPWPGKFHCHRYPSFQATHGHNNRSIPCTMQPYRRRPRPRTRG